MNWNTYIETVKCEYPNAFYSFIKFFNPHLADVTWGNILLRNNGPYILPKTNEALLDFFEQHEIYFDVLGLADMNSLGSFANRMFDNEFKKVELFAPQTFHPIFTRLEEVLLNQLVMAGIPVSRPIDRQSAQN